MSSSDKKNTMQDIRKYLTEGAEPLKDGEFREFWTSLTVEEKTEYQSMNLGGD